MAETLGQHPLSSFATPTNGDALDADVVRGHLQTVRSAYNAHDADPGVHVQSSTTASRTAAGSLGRKWMTVDAGVVRLWYDDGNDYVEVDYARASHTQNASTVLAGTFAAGDFVFPAKLTVQGQGASEQHDLGSVTGSPAIDWNNGNAQKATLGGNISPSFANGVAGATYLLRLAQDGTGSRTVTWPAAVEWPGGVAPTLTTTASRVDLLAFYFDGTSYLGSLVGFNYIV
jgi:hypothetical protein